ncbi:MAG: RraA family protein [Deltaproteobacteria bacterium]|nr:RraA family protein [Deltaproteobacteria bacterium]MCB2186298.1 RraA family protein [Deltaproteobacteria bacterium]
MSEATQLAEALLKAGTAVISDVFDNMGLVPLSLATDLWPTRGPGQSFAGPVFTVAGEMRLGPNKGDRDKLQAIDEMTPGAVALWAGHGMSGVCCFGDLLASAMQCRGVAGVVVDGGVRDLAFLRQMELGMLVQYRTPTQAIGRWKVTGWQVPVTVRGAVAQSIIVRPGDYLVADDDGAIVVPASLAVGFAGQAAAWEEKDQGARRDIMAGMKLLDALAKHGAL